MNPSKPTLNLFFERPETDRFVRHDRHVKRLLRPYYERVFGTKITGFGESFRLLVLALKHAGYGVRINDRAHAHLHPEEPVGLVGFPVLLEGWDLPNRALLGPSLYDHPGLRPDLMRHPSFHTHLVLGDWQARIFTEAYAGSCRRWFAAIAPDEWPDTRPAGSVARKDLDFVIYDKIYRDRALQERHLIAPIQAELTRRGLTFETVRYAAHKQETYRSLLARAKSMIFLCEHETQGLAYQEALMSNVPVLAWNFGWLMDPHWKVFSDSPVEASSVPFFSDRCGLTFKHARQFPERLDTFLANWASYEPRAWALENLSQDESARLYASAYFEEPDAS